MDVFISAIFGNSCGLNLSPFQSVWTDDSGKGHPLKASTEVFSCIDPSDLSAGNPWGCHVVITFGYLITAAFAIPCGYFNLDDNMIIQTIAFVLTIICWLIWTVAGFTSMEDSPSLPAINSDPNTGSQAAVLGAILFNFGFVTTVPSWVNEKHPRVSVNKSIWFSTYLCILVFFVIGLSGALSFPGVLQGPSTNTCQRQVTDPSFNCPNDLLQLLSQDQTAPAAWKNNPAAFFILKGSVYLFPIVAVVSSIPIFSIVIKYNMIENGFSPVSAFMFAVVFPWLAAAPLLYMPDVLAQFVNFTSLIFVTFTDFVVPWALYIVLQRKRSQRTLCMEDMSEHTGSHVDEVAHAHYSLPKWLGITPRTKIVLAAIMSTALTLTACLAFYQGLTQGSYHVDKQVCALVGS